MLLSYGNFNGLTYQRAANTDYSGNWCAIKDLSTGWTWENKSAVSTDLNYVGNTYTNYYSAYGTASQINASSNSVDFANAMNAQNAGNTQKVIVVRRIGADPQLVFSYLSIQLTN